LEGAAVVNNERFISRAAKFAASYFFVTCSFFIYRFSPHNRGLREFTNEHLGMSGNDFLTGAYITYSLLLLIFYLVEKTPRPSKSIFAMRALRTILFSPARTIPAGLSRDERLGLLSVLLKGFFAPIMLLSLFEFTSAMIANGQFLLGHVSALQRDFLGVFNSNGFWFMFQVILFLDVFFFTIGYLIEHPALKNEIRSVDPTLLGWAVTLACYPPFNLITIRILGGNISDFPQFSNPAMHIAVNMMMLVLMAVYASASIALNLKASNLTHRGIVSRGPYRYIRHPAYAAKNLAWWLGALPALIAAWNHSSWSFFLNLCCVAAWTTLYVMRALTEEAHLRRVDGEYDAYCRSVRHRFVPGVC